MATIILRSTKGLTLTNTEVDANFTNLNNDKLESGDSMAASELSATGSLTLSTASGLVAAGTTQGTAAPITKTYNIISTASANQGVRLPAAVAGKVVNVYNTTGATIKIYPATDATIDDGSTNAPDEIRPNNGKEFVGTGTDTWRVVGAGGNNAPDFTATIASLVAYSDSNLDFPARTFRLDTTAAQRSEQAIVNGQTISVMALSDILHFGDGYIPIPITSAMSIALTMQMSTAITSKNVRLVVDVYDSSGTSIRQVNFDDISVPSDISEVSLSLSNVLLNTDVSTATEGRVEIQRLAATTDDHSGDIQVKRAVVTYV